MVQQDWSSPLQPACLSQITIMGLEPRVQLDVAGRSENLLVDPGATYTALTSYSGDFSHAYTILSATEKTITKRFTQVLLCYWDGQIFSHQFLRCFLSVLLHYWEEMFPCLWNLAAIAILIRADKFSRSVMPNYSWSHGLQHASHILCPSLTLKGYANSSPLSRWCHPTISSCVIPFSSWLQSFPASGSFQISQVFRSGGQSIGVSASTSVLPKNIQDWSPLGLTGWISLQSKGLSRIFSNNTVQSINFLVLHFLYSPILTSIHDYWKNHSLD